MDRKSVKTTTIMVLFFILAGCLMIPGRVHNAFAAEESVENNDPSQTNAIKNGFRVIPIFYLDKNTLETIVDSKNNNCKIITSLSNQGEKEIDAPLALIAFGSEEDTLKIANYIESVDQPLSMLRLSVWCIQLNGDPDKVDKATLTLSKELLCSRAQITGMFVYFRELIREQKSKDSNSGTSFVDEKVKDTAGNYQEFYTIQKQHLKDIIVTGLKINNKSEINHNSSKYNNASYLEELCNITTTGTLSQKAEEAIKSAEKENPKKENWINSIEPVTLLDSLILLNIASGKNREKILDEYFTKVPDIITNVEIQYVEKYENRTLCEEQKKRIQEKNLRLHTFTRTRQYFNNYSIFNTKKDDYELYKNYYLSHQVNIQRLLDYRLRLYCSKELEKKLAQDLTEVKNEEEKITVARKKLADAESRITAAENSKIEALKDLTAAKKKKDEAKVKKAEDKIKKAKAEINAAEKEKVKANSVIKKEADIKKQIKDIKSALYQVRSMRENYHKAVTLCESRLSTGLREFLLALDDDIRSQFIEPAIKKVRDSSTGKNMKISSIQRTTIMATSRNRAKIAPRATAYFSIPKPEMSLIQLKKLSKYFTGATLGNVLLSIQEDQDKYKAVERTITKKTWDSSFKFLKDQNGVKIELLIGSEPIRFQSAGNEIWTPVNIDKKPIDGIKLAFTYTKDGKTENQTSLVTFKKDSADFIIPYVNIDGKDNVEVKINNHGDNNFKLAVEGVEGTLNYLRLRQGNDTAVGMTLAGKNEIEIVTEEKKDPFETNIYKIQTGLDLELAPIVLADGESALMRFKDLNFKFNPEMVKGSDYLSQINQNSITTQVTTRTFEILELGSFESQTSVTRDGNGIVPLYYVGEIIPIIRKIPLAGELFDKPKINQTQLQRSVVFVNPMIYPAVNDILDYKTVLK